MAAWTARGTQGPGRNCRRLAAARRLPDGKGASNPGVRLPAAHVIHAVGPVWPGGPANEPALLARCCSRASQTLLRRAGGRSNAFPAISMGIHGYPCAPAGSLAGAAVRQDLAEHGDLDVAFALFDAESPALYEKEPAA